MQPMCDSNITHTIYIINIHNWLQRLRFPYRDEQCWIFNSVNVCQVHTTISIIIENVTFIRLRSSHRHNKHSKSKGLNLIRHSDQSQHSRQSESNNHSSHNLQPFSATNLMIFEPMCVVCDWNAARRGGHQHRNNEPLIMLIVSVFCVVVPSSSHTRTEHIRRLIKYSWWQIFKDITCNALPSSNAMHAF